MSPGRGWLNWEFLGGIWVIMGGDGAAFCYKRLWIHKKLGVLAPTGMTALPELGRRGRSHGQVAQSGYE